MSDAPHDTNAPAVDGGITAPRSGFVFDEHVAPKFDSHVRKSVPDYDYLQTLAGQLSDWFVRDGGTVIDIGASTGESLCRVRDRNPAKKLRLLGYDNSTAMIQQAKEKGIEVIFSDAGELLKVLPFNYGLALYTLQFLRPGERHRILSTLYSCMMDGGALFVVEKVLGSVPEFQDLTAQLYWDMKLRNGLNPEEVLNKAAALRGVMHPITVEENEHAFRKVGFQRIELIYRNLQFAGWIVQK